MSEELLTVDELAKELKVQKSWVYSKSRIKDSNSIPMVIVGKYRRFRLTDVLRWLDKQTFIKTKNI